MKIFRRVSFQYMAIVCLCVASFGFNSCKNKKLDPLYIDPAFASYVISFTSGVVSSAATIKVRLVEEQEQAVPGEELPNNPFSISPKILGKAVWLDKQTIEFIPEKRMNSGEIYTVEFALHKFVEVPKDLKTLTFRFQVMKQGIQYEFNGIEPYKETEKKWQMIHGYFTTADVVELQELEKAVSAEGEGVKYSLTWTHSPDGKQHFFIIDSVERKEKARTIKLRCNGKAIGVDEVTTHSIEMPALQDFKVIHVKTHTSPKTFIELFFSDPISKTQDKNGLVQLENLAFSTIFKGNVVQIIPNKTVIGDVKIIVHAGLQNVFQASLGKEFQTIVKFASQKPQVKLLGEGVIVPNVNGVLFPFEAVSLTAVDVQIIQIFENNIPQFLQVNQYDGSRELKRVGRIVFNQEIPLVSEKSIDYKEWNTFSLDLSKLIETEPGAIYRVQIGFRKKHSIYACSEDDAAEEDEYTPEKNIQAEYDQPSSSYWDYYDDEDYYYYDDYNWYDRDNPCKSSYYARGRNVVVRNILASDMGIIAKAGSNNEYVIAISDIRTAEPMSGVEVELRNYQNQVLKKASTNSDGIVKMQLDAKPFLLIAKKGKQRGYLRLDDASSLSVSMFDVQGEELKKGVKGFIYGERGVWRPGDSLYITFILEDKNKALPSNHPVIFELYNPENQISQKIVRTSNVNGFYSFKIATSDDAPTGNWLAKVRVGGSVFSKTLKIETVKPNKMKIRLEYPQKILRSGVTEVGKLQVDWLHGLPAKNAKVIIDATIAPAKTSFDGYKEYIFDDPSKEFSSKEFTVFQGNVGENGSAQIHTNIDVQANTPGKVAVQMKTRAFEQGGDFSIDRFIVEYSPYKTYVGVKIPEGDGWNNALYSNEKNVFPIVTVNELGKPVDRKLRVEIFDIYWRWWWDRSSEENLANYITNNYRNKLQSHDLVSKNGKVMFEMNLGGDYWGRKLIRVTDIESGHSTGAVFYTTYKGWWSNAGSQKPGGAEMLMFETDKKQYNVGDKISVELPATHKGRALVSIETGSKVVQTFWISDKESVFSFTATPEMSPNIYIHISYIQPYLHSENDYPIRMYGIQSVKIENPETVLKPEIRMNSTLKPEEKFTVQVKESNGKAMTYTLAIVDEGLLDLTRFKTPNPWTTFYSQEALGVRTWDLYKYVSGAFTGRMAGLLAVGGDEYIDKQGKENANRFKPVVLFAGPFALKAGESKTHSFTMPNYVGSVRVMVVAGQQGAYGCAEQAVPVKQDLMILPTLPRVISPGEVIQVPVTVFAMDKKIQNVQVQLVLDNNFEALDGTQRTVQFAKEGEKIVSFSVKAKERVAQGKINVQATSGSVKASSETNLNIRMPNPPSYDVVKVVIKPGETWTHQIKAIGVTGTNTGKIEISRLRPLDLEKRLQYLIRYPHGCIEQITSAVFPQLFLQNLIELSQERRTEIDANVQAYLEKLKSYQLSSGAFAYWPGESAYANEWGTNYAGHCMIEAQSLGYQLPVGVFDAWVTSQTTEANNWRTSVYSRGDTDVAQAYRLYTLALAKKPAMSAMNRLRETHDISEQAKWRLAAAYAISGRKDVAEKIIEKMKIRMDKQSIYANYGSYERDIAMILETLVLLNKNEEAKVLVDDLALVLSSDKWLSTQTSAYMLLAISKFAGTKYDNSKIQCTIALQGKKQSVSSDNYMYQKSLDFSQTKDYQMTITNTMKQELYVRVQLHGVPSMVQMPASSENLGIQIRYFDMKGNSIQPFALKQGTDFYAKVEVTHPGFRSDYTDLAVSHIFPSGWEIMNSRMDEIRISQQQGIRYQDIRDDRVYSYFDLATGKTKEYTILLHAAYVGKFFLPAVYCEAMYDNTIHARTSGQWIEVVK